jgi:hypothetical protein
MRLFIHGMQSSGATAFTRMLAERPGCVALVDIPNNYAAPRVTTALDFVAKAVITTAYPLATHVERFRPDRTLLFLRDPRDNYESLRTKPYRHYSGLMEEKFILLDQLFSEPQRFDAIIHYEDVITPQAAVLAELARLGWPVTPDWYQYSRSYDEMLRSLWAAEPMLMQNMEVVFGNARGPGLSAQFREKPRTPEAEILLEQLCPRLLAHYRARDAARGNQS